jgi:hypothetical protein
MKSRRGGFDQRFLSLKMGFISHQCTRFFVYSE